MATVDFTSMILSMREKLTKPLLIITVLFIVAAFYLGWGFWLVAAILLVFVTFINGMYVIMPGHAGYKITLGAMANKSFSAGFGWMIPFISSMSEVDITRQRHQDTNNMKNKERRDIALTYVLTWNLNPAHVHTLHATRIRFIQGRNNASCRNCALYDSKLHPFPINCSFQQYPN